jgi:hypothetical protein
MDAKDIAAVAKWLRSEIGVQFVVVGGSAVERVVPVATKDVDVLIDRKDWKRVDAALEGRQDASPLSPLSGSIRDTIVQIGNSRIDLEFLSDEPFRGIAPSGSFNRYVRERGSVIDRGIRYATPAVVFYMRLNAPEGWESYVPSIERDLVSGVAPRTLDDAALIAERFGLGPRTRKRIERVHQILDSHA